MGRRRAWFQLKRLIAIPKPSPSEKTSLSPLSLSLCKQADGGAAKCALKSGTSINIAECDRSMHADYYTIQSLPPLVHWGTRISFEIYISFHIGLRGGIIAFAGDQYHEAEEYLDVVRKHASGLLPEMRKDDYAVVEKPMLMTWMQGGADYIVLKNLDIDGIRIIGSVLGQSIALDHYIRQVDDIVEEFTDINRGMEKTGTFTMQRKKLFQLVGKANSNLADVIIKLGLFDRSEIAWRNANYAQILEYLREEYELTQRFGSLDFKLKFVEHNIHFLQEVLQNRRSDLLEWGVIILLTIENIISMYEILNPS
ncbi:uncharacterized protein A4U43_C03F20300 [Asparagus officinalis]|uniref:DUF155 domain-containing protein n=1 Tax=Asparagus officinalis TaxID=4686 RepID=A0A5P1FBN4_ASPOF|nr:uncharacterized protein A4U43_C03F20300 [Asparagus officinalis]